MRDLVPEHGRELLGREPRVLMLSAARARQAAVEAGIPVEKIRIVQGDSDMIPAGGGTGGSRSVTTQSAAGIRSTWPG